jgi:hypothetical protein
VVVRLTGPLSRVFFFLYPIYAPYFSLTLLKLFSESADTMTGLMNGRMTGLMAGILREGKHADCERVEHDSGGTCRDALHPQIPLSKYSPIRQSMLCADK